MKGFAFVFAIKKFRCFSNFPVLLKCDSKIIYCRLCHYELLTIAMQHHSVQNTGLLFPPNFAIQLPKAKRLASNGHLFREPPNHRNRNRCPNSK